METCVAAFALLACAGTSLAASGLVIEPAALELTGGAQDAAPADPTAPPAETGWLAGWDGSVEIGLNGSSGNSEQLNFRGAATATKKLELWTYKIGLTYTRAQEGSDTTENRFVADGLTERLFAKDSKWRYFGQAKYEYDDFKDWLHRISFGAGVGYAFIENDKTFLLGRVGLGMYREIGGVDDAWHPEGILGAEFTHKFTDRQKISAMVELYPSLDSAGDFRSREKVEYEILVDPEVKMSLKAGIEHEHDSEPGPGFNKNDVRYYLMLVWSF